MTLPRVILQELEILAPLVETSDPNYVEEKRLHVGAMVYNTVDNPSKQLYMGVYTWDGEIWTFMVSATQNFTLTVEPKVLLFSSGLTPETLNSQNVKANWLPTDARCAFSLAPLLGGGVSNSSPLSNGILGGIYTQSLELTPMTSTEIDNSPFLEKVSTLNVTVNDGGAFKTEKVLVRQQHYNLLISQFESEPELGKTYTAKIRTNTKWRATVTKGALVVASYTSDGDPNTIFTFTLESDDILEGTDIQFKFESIDDDGTTVNNKIAPVFISAKATREYPNAFFIKPGFPFEFPIRKAYNVWKDEFNENLAGAVEVELLWQDEMSLITAAALKGNEDKRINSIIRITTPSDKTGNAIVAVKIGGEIRWSWHLWVTEYNPNVTVNESGTPIAHPVFQENAADSAYVNAGKIYSYYNSKTASVLMDRFLGATTWEPGLQSSMSLLYQWGRKDPFPRFKDITITGSLPAGASMPIYNINNVLVENSFEDTVEDINQTKAIMNPKIFYKGVVSNDEDWYSKNVDTHNDLLWTAKDKKSVYDPCPLGWRLPIGGVATEATFFNLPNMPYNATSRAFDMRGAGAGIFQMNGFIHSTSERYSYAGVYTWIWTATSIGAHSQDFVVDQSGVPNPGHSYSRAYAMGVRCIRDDK